MTLNGVYGGVVIVMELGPGRKSALAMIPKVKDVMLGLKKQHLVTRNRIVKVLVIVMTTNT